MGDKRYQEWKTTSNVWSRAVAEDAVVAHAAYVVAGMNGATVVESDFEMSNREAMLSSVPR